MSAGKGDRYRPVDREKYEENYEKLFGTESCPLGLEDDRSTCTARTCKRCKQEKREADYNNREYKKDPRTYG